MPNPLKKKKVLVLLPDGIGLRNFAYTDFYKAGRALDFEIAYWNNTPFDLAGLGFNEIKMEGFKGHPATEIYKNARKHVELNLFVKKFDDPTYDSYRFPFSRGTFKQKLKTFLTKRVISNYNSEEKLKQLAQKIYLLESKTSYFDKCLETLQKERPDFVFCTNQRPMSAIAPIEAAKKLGIPTGTFIFSWDNLPKATMVIDTDYYFVWSNFMKNELVKYYPDIDAHRIIVTGTPQFENHFNSSIRIERTTFFETHKLDLSKKYICFSGDDITTSPNDPSYLKDTAEAIRNLNKRGYNLGIIFRCCPVDFSSRFDSVLEEYQDVIVSIRPLWKKIGDAWNTVLPTYEDMVLQTNTIAHTEFVINLGSSMVFDYACYNKPCAYVNYDVANSLFPKWNVTKVYNYIHFRSMPDTNSVVWFNTPDEIEQKIISVLEGKTSTLESAQKWFETINEHPVSCASERIWNFIKTVSA